MLPALLLPLALLTMGDPPIEPGRFEFFDAAVHEGRSVLRYRNVELRSTPARDIRADTGFEDDSLYGLVPIGESPDQALLLAWLHPAQSPSRVWLDTDGDGRPAERELYALSDGWHDIPVDLPLPSGDAALQVRRTLILRRAALGTGLQFAVRGYRAGLLPVGARQHRALLTDGDADGLFHAPGSDRIWIDFNDDGRFDGLTEQYPLGSPITVGDDKFVVSADASGEFVQARCRSRESGLLRVTLFDDDRPPPEKLIASFVSDIGELAHVEAVDKSVSLPVAAYRLAALTLQMTDPSGELWTYDFKGRGKCDTSVETGKSTSIGLMDGLKLELDIKPARESDFLYQEVTVTPRITTTTGLYLTDCRQGNTRRIGTQSRAAQISVVSDAGETVFDAQSGFA